MKKNILFIIMLIIPTWIFAQGTSYIQKGDTLLEVVAKNTVIATGLPTDIYLSTEQLGKLKAGELITVNYTSFTLDKNFGFLISYKNSITKTYQKENGFILIRRVNLIKGFDVTNILPIVTILFLFFGQIVLGRKGLFGSFYLIFSLGLLLMEMFMSFATSGTTSEVFRQSWIIYSVIVILNVALYLYMKRWYKRHQEKFKKALNTVS